MCFVVTVKLCSCYCLLCVYCYSNCLCYCCYCAEGYAQGDKIADKLDTDGFPSIGMYFTEGDPLYR